MTDGTNLVSVELYVRSLAPDATRPAIEAVVERLQRLEAAGTVAGVTVHVTGGKVCPDGPTARTDAGRFLLDRVASFEAWADRTGRSISGAFRRLEAARGIDGSDHSGVVFPAMAMAEYEGDDLRFVAPATDGATVHTVRDRLDVIESGTPATARDGTGEQVD